MSTPVCATAALGALVVVLFFGAVGRDRAWRDGHAMGRAAERADQERKAEPADLGDRDNLGAA